MLTQRTTGFSISEKVLFPVSSAVENRGRYFDIFIDDQIPLWKRIIGGATLPIAGPLFLLTGCSSSNLTPIPSEKPSPDDYVVLPPDEPQEEEVTVENNEPDDDTIDNTAGEEPVDSEPISDDDLDVDDDTDVVDPDETVEELPADESDDDVIDDDVADDDTFLEEPAHDCEPGEYRPCGPCDLGLVACTSEYLWGECEGLSGVTVAVCYDGPAGTENVGACREGLQRCVYYGGESVWGWSACEDEIQPTVEICDGIDNDCNGLVDDATTNCADGSYCAAGGHCEPMPLLCRVTDSFEFGDDFSSHSYEQSWGVSTSEDNSVHGCGAARGVYFEADGEWVKVSLAVDPRSESVRVNTRSHNAFSIIRLEGFDCHNPIVGSYCYASDFCSLTTSIWETDRFSSPRFADGFVDVIITGARIEEGFFGPSPDDEHPDIATIEIESCFRAIP